MPNKIKLVREIEKYQRLVKWRNERGQKNTLAHVRLQKLEEELAKLEARENGKQNLEGYDSQDRRRNGSTDGNNELDEPSKSSVKPRATRGHSPKRRRTNVSKRSSGVDTTA
jgi:single-stranded DNA-binding protein